MTDPTKIPKRGIDKAAAAKLEQVRRMSGGCATCAKVRSGIKAAINAVRKLGK